MGGAGGDVAGGIPEGDFLGRTGQDNRRGEEEQGESNWRVRVIVAWVESSSVKVVGFQGNTGRSSLTACALAGHPSFRGCGIRNEQVVRRLDYPPRLLPRSSVTCDESAERCDGNDRPHVLFSTPFGGLVLRARPREGKVRQPSRRSRPGEWRKRFGRDRPAVRHTPWTRGGGDEMQGAFNGKYLRVDLTQGTTSVEQFPELEYRLFMGGAAMAAAILMKELKPGVDPLGPDNVMVDLHLSAERDPALRHQPLHRGRQVAAHRRVRRGRGRRLVGAGAEVRRLRRHHRDRSVAEAGVPLDHRRQGGAARCRPPLGQDLGRGAGHPGGRDRQAGARAPVRDRRREGLPARQHRERAQALQRPVGPRRRDGQQEAARHRRPREGQAGAQEQGGAAGGPEVDARALRPREGHAAQVRHLPERGGHERRRDPAHPELPRGAVRGGQGDQRPDHGRDDPHRRRDLLRLRHRLQARRGRPRAGRDVEVRRAGVRDDRVQRARSAASAT